MSPQEKRDPNQSEPTLQSVFAEIRGKLDEKDRVDIWTYVRADEWGEALDLMIFLVERRGLPISNATRDRIYRLAAEIDFDLDARRKSWPK